MFIITITYNPKPSVLLLLVYVPAADTGGCHLAQAGDADDQSQLRSSGTDQSASMGTIAANIMQV
jgi:hypothetical protein